MKTTVPTSFADFTYVRPDMAQIEQQMQRFLQTFSEATTFSQAKSAMKDIYAVRSDFDRAYNIAYIRHSCDTKDAFYEAENSFFDEQLPIFEKYKAQFYQALLASSVRPALEEEYGQQLFAIASLKLRTFKPEIIEDLQEENRLASAYTKLKASAQITFQGDVYNLSSILPLEESRDRSIRAGAANAKWEWLNTQRVEIERIFDDLVQVRDRVAKQLGFNNFVELGYARMLRTDYSADEVASFREQIREHIVPIASALYEQQRKRLGIEQLKFYDENIRFPNGNAQPKGDPAWIIEQATTMYRELSAETDEFFDLMRSQQLMDLVSRDGKATGGYCTFIPEEKVPFIFSNFNGTSGDIDVLTHEAGHAFQVYSSRNVPISEYQWPTYEACEIHSMSMEFFTWPWMKLFFKEQVDQYYYGHLAGAISFLPYGVAVDEFQHFVYEYPNATPEERNAAWKKIEAKYLPQRDYDGVTMLEEGGFWQRQTHIFGMPFYYIDYTLAQICAFQFWLRDQEDHASAWADYVRLCKAGGSQAFLGLVALANLRSPFEAGCVQETAAAIKEWLTSVELE